MGDGSEGWEVGGDIGPQNGPQNGLTTSGISDDLLRAPTEPQTTKEKMPASLDHLLEPIPLPPALLQSHQEW